MRKVLALVALLIFTHALSAHATAPTTCSVSGVVYDGAGNPVPNAIIYFNSRTTQIVNGNTVYPINKTSTTDANGNLSATALVQGLLLQITICQAQGGGCSAPTTGYVPISASTTFANLLAGQAVGTVATLSGNLNASGFRIYNLGVNTTLADALSQGQSSLNNLTTPTGNYAMGGFKLTGVGMGTGSGDSLAYGLNGLNSLAAPTGNYSMGGFTLTNLAAPTASGQPLPFSTNSDVVFGDGAGAALSGTLQNTVLGYGADPISSTGADNTAVGYNSLLVATSGGFNTAVGWDSGNVLTTGHYNVLLGASGPNITTGSSNIVIGQGLADTTATGSFQLDIGDTITGTLVGGSTPNVKYLVPVSNNIGTIAALPSCTSGLVGAVSSVTNSDSACSFNSAPTHSSCTIGTNCYTCQVQCAEAGSTSYAWIAY